jgi:hypothetical protein
MGRVFAQKEDEGLLVARDRDGVSSRFIEYLTGTPIQIRGSEDLVRKNGGIGQP